MPKQLTPQQASQLKSLLTNQEWRLNHLYWITDKDGNTVRFHLNWAQQDLHRNAHTRNNILKVRQLGISTYLALLILDSCLFTPNFHAGIVDRTLPEAEKKLAKITFAYEHLDHLPENPTPLDRELAALGTELKKHFPLKKDTSAPDITHLTTLGQKKITFSNRSTICIGVTYRGDTLQLLHVSELGSIAAHDPIRASEIQTGSFPCVATNGHLYLESTHEGGKWGINYELLLTSMDNIGHTLTPLDFKFFFFPWYKHPEYALPNINPHLTVEENRYFDTLQKDLSITITLAQRAWYTAMSRTQRSKMRQEFPSTPDEAISPIADGTIYYSQLTALAERGHLSAHFEPSPHRPIYTAWDLGTADYMSIWWIQPDGKGHYLILANYTANRKPLTHYLDILRQRDADWGRCTAVILPHDSSTNDRHLTTWEDDFRAAGYTCKRVPRTTDKWQSIDNTRDLLRTCIFHARCSEPTIPTGETTRYPSGLDSLKLYSTAPPGASGTLRNEPLHNIYSHASDALRCFADALTHGLISPELGWQNTTRRSPLKRDAFTQSFFS